MTYDDLVTILKPHRWGNHDVEAFETYRDRVRPILTNWPDNPLEHWLWEHYGDVVSEYSWLGFDLMAFRLEDWTKDRVYQDINSHIMDAIDGPGQQIYTSVGVMRTPLQRFFLTERTWRVPIIILNNKYHLQKHGAAPYGRPGHLLEGHRRLGYFRNVYRKEPETLMPTHRVWVVEVPKPESEA